jgi:hypothetical protein
MAELVDALVSNTCGKPCRFEPGSGYKASDFFWSFFFGPGSKLQRLSWKASDFFWSFFWSGFKLAKVELESFRFFLELFFDVV